MQKRTQHVPDGRDRTAGFHVARLDTLRALAVTVVLLFHLRPDLLPWGYIGVDMFFSLSGFLMTWLYLMARSRGEVLTAGRFLLRRFWRIFPPLAITVSVTLVVGTLLLGPQHLEELAGSALAALFSVSNVLFFLQAGYFDTDATFKPLLHTWSLGVEEQFYAAFALALLATRAVPLWLFLLVAASASFGLWAWVILADLGSLWPGLHDEPYGALFFLPQYRAFQFAAGGLVAYGVHLARDRPMPRALTAIGLVSLLAGFWVASDKNAAHLAAAITTVGVGILMLRAPVLDRLAESGATRYVATISYQLYLVHWPVIVFWQYYTLSPLTGAGALICVALCILLADLLYRITNPMRT